MKKNLDIVLFLSLLFLLFTSCKKEQSLQSYLVENQDKKGFIAADIPASMLRISNKTTSSDTDKTNALESIKKINVVGMPYQGNEEKYEKEKNKLKSIFANSKKYKPLFSVKDKKINIKLYYLGDTENINEVVAFGYSDKMGVGVARLLGDNMNPEKIMEAFKDVDFNNNSEKVKDLINIFDGNKFLKIEEIEAETSKE